ncbi:hypothetical protein EYC84_008221 [Monilinia fructicola]|uniref:Uncharacterized protein n=1 Tax=Monilinia fructicola TaxID=38448 RepID=A0A5M9JHD7_MONFR|nr:hypothetical protein EYC84_008221 [Monilinia fructicola]
MATRNSRRDYHIVVLGADTAGTEQFTAMSDLEQDRVVSRQTAFNVSQSWGNAPYYETSARRRANVDEVFIDLCRQIIRRDNNRSTPELDDEVHSPVDKKHHRMRRLGRCVYFMIAL